MSDHGERQVLFFDLYVEANGFEGRYGVVRGLTPVPMERLGEMVVQLFKQKKLPMRSNRTDSETTYLSDAGFHDGKKFLCLLFNRSDTRAADLVITNPRKSSRRRVVKDTGEGHDYSAHLLIKTAAIKPNTYHCLLEVASGLPGSRVQKFLNLLARLLSKEFKAEMSVPHVNRATDKNGKPKMLNRRHKMKLKGHPSPSFLLELQRGELGSVELIEDRKRVQNWDGNSYLIEKSKTVKLIPAGQTKPGQIVDVIKGVAALADTRNYDRMRIRYKTLEGMGRVAAIETQTFQMAADELFIRKEPIRNFTDKLPTSFDKMHLEVVQRMAVYL